ncbi:hypothetical protein EMIHUDRAFT_227035 [Emiliania huxleyi CCMP1516]|uniref:Uncharacterized protein n=2 Tax=Emiliania huxleyi TaxID=2903 RepID=A0A0D3KJJ6_EMIH1|nr:hypothetical protein EMIHUDRAFT_227035 [Emiliania huxleyi CCMP1516]EOD35931.1 hypothetical protein EMIHUDRAFT_227035 [Emiliania huxleyi CCMP1516]|eukprot:XP_005788360.1 hypothetical protein EMIHUDRAFT_227035 [Emiliania huxleyi CCMP1516]
MCAATLILLSFRGRAKQKRHRERIRRLLGIQQELLIQAVVQIDTRVERKKRDSMYQQLRRERESRKAVGEEKVHSVRLAVRRDC